MQKTSSRYHLFVRLDSDPDRNWRLIGEVDAAGAAEARREAVNSNASLTEAAKNGTLEVAAVAATNFKPKRPEFEPPKLKV